METSPGKTGTTATGVATAVAIGTTATGVATGVAAGTTATGVATGVPTGVATGAGVTHAVFTIVFASRVTAAFRAKSCP